MLLMGDSRYGVCLVCFGGLEEYGARGGLLSLWLGVMVLYFFDVSVSFGSIIEGV